MIDRDKDFTLGGLGMKTGTGGYAFSFLSLFLLLLLIYGNSFDCSWHFDDYINIVENAKVHIGSLSWQEVEPGLHGIGGGAHWQRPLSYFSFALNYDADGLNVFGYHLVNFFIHYLASVFLFLFIYNVLRLPIHGGRYERHAYSIALLSAVFWAVNPVQVVAVTYIVQRMASMTAMFYIMAMYFYLKGRTGERTWKNVLFYVLAVICVVLSIGSKENAAMVSVSIFLFDLFLIQGVTVVNIRRSWVWGLLALLFVPAVGLMYWDFSSIVGDYELRPFTMLERVLTQPRVILFYISLLFYPVTSRLMLIHDMPISRSLFDPWTTVAAMVVILLILVVAVLVSRRRPLIAYCIFFFFLNHLIEGSFLSLELVYEHRNYLPSMLIFVPLSVLIVHGLDYYSDRRQMFLVLSSSVTFVMILLGVTVFIQNDIWKDDVSLWSDNFEKAPNLHHVRQNLGTSYFIAGRFPEAFGELTKALESFAATDITAKAKTHGLLGEYYLMNGDDDRALAHYQKALQFRPAFAPIYNRIAEIMMRKNQLTEAEKLIRTGIAIRPHSPAFRLTLSRIFLKQDQPDAAIKEAQQALMLGRDSLKPYTVMAEAFRIKKDIKTADHFRKLGERSNAKDAACESFERL
jgi:tetratricopeptide (TPR) repeat protein